MLYGGIGLQWVNQDLPWSTWFSLNSQNTHAKPWSHPPIITTMPAIMKINGCYSALIGVIWKLITYNMLTHKQLETCTQLCSYWWHQYPQLTKCSLHWISFIQKYYRYRKQYQKMKLQFFKYSIVRVKWKISWWRHQMETFSPLLAICVGNSPVSGEFPAQRPATQSFDVFFDQRLNKRLSKQTLMRLVIWDAFAPIMTSQWWSAYRNLYCKIWLTHGPI